MGMGLLTRGYILPKRKVIYDVPGEVVPGALDDENIMVTMEAGDVIPVEEQGPSISEDDDSPRVLSEDDSTIIKPGCS